MGVKINLDNVGYNVRSILKKYPEYEYYIGVVKGNAYGHGMYIVNELIENGINYLAVSSILEGIEIRKYNKDIPILLLVPILFTKVEVAVENNFTLTVPDLDYLKELLKMKIKKELKVHLALDTGLNRIGFKNKEDIKEAVELLAKKDLINLEGVYTHFGTIGMYDDKWDKQVTKFTELTSLIDLQGLIVHVGSSVILQTHPKLTFCNGFRIGTLLYGYNVSPSLSSGFKDKLRLKKLNYCQKKYNLSEFKLGEKLDLLPAIKMTTNIVQIKKAKKNEFIGYGATYVCKEDMLVATLPVGYYNGIGKNKTYRYVLINNKPYEVVGEIGMNMMMVKIDKEVSLDDEVIILGDKITIGLLASFGGVSFVECLLNIGNNNKKEYIKDGNIVYREE